MMVAVPFCNSCNMRVDVGRDKCPRCGATTRFKIMRRKVADRLEGEKAGENGYIRPPSSS